jgi:5-methylcytosine-specific restriction endonuclease McrA
MDRIDSSKNYSKENVVPCCKQCNSAKSTLSQEEFFNMIKAIYKNMVLEKQ